MSENSSSGVLSNESPNTNNRKRKAEDNDESQKPNTPITYSYDDMVEKLGDFGKEILKIRGQKTQLDRKKSKYVRCLSAVDYAIDILEKATSFISLKDKEVDNSTDSIESCLFKSKTSILSPKTKTPQSAQRIQALCRSVSSFCGMAVAETIMTNRNKMERLQRWVDNIDILYEIITRKRDEIMDAIQQIEPNYKKKERINLLFFNDRDHRIVNFLHKNNIHNFELIVGEKRYIFNENEILVATEQSSGGEEDASNSGEVNTTDENEYERMSKKRRKSM